MDWDKLQRLWQRASRQLYIPLFESITLAYHEYSYLFVFLFQSLFIITTREGHTFSINVHLYTR